VGDFRSFQDWRWIVVAQAYTTKFHDTKLAKTSALYGSNSNHRPLEERSTTVLPGKLRHTYTHSADLNQVSAPLQSQCLGEFAICCQIWKKVPPCDNLELHWVGRQAEWDKSWSRLNLPLDLRRDDSQLIGAKTIITLSLFGGFRDEREVHMPRRRCISQAK